jgi:fluoroquinolone transport system permease protein
MLMTTLVRRLGRSDVKLIGRDRFLIFMFMFALYIAVALRYLLPWANAYLAQNGVMPGDTIPLPLSDVYPMLVAYLGIYTGALLVGTVFGFVLLDERDNNTLRAMLVTPVPLKRYVMYRVYGPAILAFFIILGMVLFINQALLPLWQMILISAGGALTAPIISLFFATFAENKVQGFAYSKFGGISGWTIMIGFFVAEPWQWLIGLYPPFWISKAYWLALEGNSWWWAALIAGVVLQIGLINWLIQRFNQVAYR